MMSKYFSRTTQLLVGPSLRGQKGALTMKSSMCFSQFNCDSCLKKLSYPECKSCHKMVNYFKVFDLYECIYSVPKTTQSMLNG